MEHDVQVK
jgi:hypothetical protein